MRRFRGRRVVLLRVIAVWLITAASLMLLSALLPGVAVTSAGAALGAAALIGLLNALVWPLLIRFALPFTVLTLGLGVLVLNAAILLGAAWLLDDVQLDGLFEAVVVTLGLTLITT